MLPLPALRLLSPSSLPVSSIRYPLADLSLRSRLLRLIIKFPFWRTSIAAPLFRCPYRLLFIDSLTLSRFDPSYVFTAPIHRICIRIYGRIYDHSHSRVPLLSAFLSVSTFHSSRLLFLFFRFYPLPRLSIYESGRYGVAPRLFASGDL